MNEATNERSADTNLVQLTADIVSAFASSPNNTITAADLPSLISQVHTALSTVGTPAQPEVKLEPAVSIRRSVQRDHIVCLEDGKKLKMLKRHLMTAFGLTPDQYRAKWGLPADYPMVAPDYAETRRTLAKSIGLGRHRTRTAPSSNAAPDAKVEAKVETKAKAKAEAKPKAASKPRGRPKGSGNKPKATTTA
jgi:predicted transcriptional regulator